MLLIITIIILLIITTISSLYYDLVNLRPSEEGEAAFEELERTFASLNFEDVFQKMEITNAGIFSPSLHCQNKLKQSPIGCRA